MSVLDSLIRMQAGYDDQGMKSITGLTEAVGNLAEQRGRSSYEQAAVKFFTDEDVSPENIQRFASMYPYVSPVETWKIAGEMEKHKKAQKLKDLGRTVMRIAAESGGTIPEEARAELLKKADPSVLSELMGHLQSFKKAHPDIKIGPVLKGGETADVFVDGRHTTTLRGEPGEPVGKYKVGELVKVWRDNGRGEAVEFQATVERLNADGSPIFGNFVEIQKTPPEKRDDRLVYLENKDKLHKRRPGIYPALTEEEEAEREALVAVKRDYVPYGFSFVPTPQGMQPVNRGVPAGQPIPDTVEETFYSPDGKHQVTTRSDSEKRWYRENKWTKEKPIGKGSRASLFDSQIPGGAPTTTASPPTAPAAVSAPPAPGPPSNSGVPGRRKYSTPVEVKTAYQNNEIGYEEALRLLQGFTVERR